ncbi:MAG: metallophosphoesterase [bacterium]|nr:metallophosphoesterase [bacterium]
MKFAWLTDIHFDFLKVEQIAEFLLSLKALETDAVVISGDIGLARNVREFLRMIEYVVPGTVYFVLGNHDFYGSSIQKVRAAIGALTETSPKLRWLPTAGVVELSAQVGMIGHDSWPDGRLGNYATSRVELNDYHLIHEFIGLDKAARLAVMNRLGDEAAAYFRQTLPAALSRHEHVYLVTHVPPFRDACWHQGRISGPDWLPHFGCKAVGDVLLDVMHHHPQKRLTVFCGHTHGRGRVDILPNLRVLTGGAEYGAPEVQQVFEV